MLTTRRRLAWVSSLLARSPRCTARIRRRVSTSSSGSASAASSMRCGGEVALLDQLGQPPLVVAGEQVDLADLAQVHAHAVGRHALGPRRRPLDPAPAAPAEQVLVGVVATRARRPAGRRSACRRRSSTSSASSTVSSSAMPGLGRACWLIESRTSPVSSTSRSTWVTCSAWTLPCWRPRSISDAPLGGVDTVDSGRDGRARQSSLVPSGDSSTSPTARVPPSGDGANLATTPQPPAAAIGVAKLLQVQAGLGDRRGSARRRRSRSRRASCAAHGGGDQVARLGLGIDVEVGDRGPLEHLAGVGVGGLDRRVEVAARRRPGRGTPGGWRRRRTAPRPATRRSSPSPGRAAATATNSAFSRDRRAPRRGDGDRRARGPAARRSRTRSATGRPTSAATWPA